MKTQGLRTKKRIVPFVGGSGACVAPGVNPFRTAIHGNRHLHLTLIPSSLSPKRGCSPKGVNIVSCMVCYCQGIKRSVFFSVTPLTMPHYMPHRARTCCTHVCTSRRSSSRPESSATATSPRSAKLSTRRPSWRFSSEPGYGTFGRASTRWMDS